MAVFSALIFSPRRWALKDIFELASVRNRLRVRNEPQRARSL